VAEKIEINSQTYHYCGFARDLMQNGSNKGMETLAKHVPECVTCLQAQNSEEFASSADSIGKKLKN